MILTIETTKNSTSVSTQDVLDTITALTAERDAARAQMANLETRVEGLCKDLNRNVVRGDIFCVEVADLREKLERVKGPVEKWKTSEWAYANCARGNSAEDICADELQAALEEKE